MGSGWGVVLGTPTIMADHPGIAFSKMVFDHGVPASMVNHKIGGQTHSQHFFPAILVPVSSDPIQAAFMTFSLIVSMIPLACRCMWASLLAMVPSEMANPSRS